MCAVVLGVVLQKVILGSREAPSNFISFRRGIAYVGAAEGNARAQGFRWARNDCTIVRVEGIHAEDGKDFCVAARTLIVAVGARQHLRVNQRHEAPVVIDAKADDAKADDAKAEDSGSRQCKGRR